VKRGFGPDPGTPWLKTIATSLRAKCLALGISVLACAGGYSFLKWRSAEFAKNLGRWEKLEAYARTADLKEVVDQAGDFYHGIDRGYPLTEYADLVDDPIDYVEIHATDGVVWSQRICGRRWIFAVYDEAQPRSRQILKNSFGGEIYRKPGFVVFRRGFRD
jgi:hypothetical protein